MKRYFIYLFLVAISLQLSAQQIKVDIFDDLEYQSENGQYKANLKKNIFDDLVFSDNNNNELTFRKKYLEIENKILLEDEEARIDFFRHLIRRYRSEEKYKASFSVNIFDDIVIEDNRNNKIKKGTDIFGHPVYEEKFNGVETTIKRDLSGNPEYKSGKEQATLKKDIFNKWIYQDSSGNKFEFSDQTWNSLMDQYGSDENILYFLINEFLYNYKY